MTNKNIKKKSNYQGNCNICVKVYPGLLEKALKDLKFKTKKYGIMDTYRENQEFIKPSAKRREQLAIAKNLEKRRVYY